MEEDKMKRGKSYTSLYDKRADGRGQAKGASCVEYRKAAGAQRADASPQALRPPFGVVQLFAAIREVAFS
jgi:hypothetical protein